MVYDTYTPRRAYTSSSRPTISSYTATPYYHRHFFDDDFTPSYSSYSYSAPIRVFPTYQRVGSYLSRPSFRFNYDTQYTELPYHSYNRIAPIPLTRITTSPSRVYRERLSPIRIITPSARIYRRDINSPVRLVTSPARIVNIRVRPSTLSKEFDRIDRKYRTSPIGVNDTEHYLNSAYALNFNDATREIRASTKRLMKEIHEPVPRAQSVPRFLRAASLQPSYSRFDPDLIDRYGNALIENEYHVNKNILRPTRKTRDQIEILARIKYPDTPRRYTARLGLDPARESRKFDEQKLIEDPSVVRKELADLKSSSRLGKVHEVDEDLEKIKQQRLQERKLREEQALKQEKEQIKKEEEARRAEVERQERLAAQAAADRQAELDRKAAEEAHAIEEARLEAEAEQQRIADEAEAARLAQEAAAQAAADAEAAKLAKVAAKAAAEQAAADEAARLAEEARVAAELAAKAAEEEAARQAEAERAAELEKIKAEEVRLAELEQLAKEEEEVELARQANELAELARSQTQELQSEETPVDAEEVATSPEPTEDSPVVEAPESPVSEDAPSVEVTVDEPAVEESIAEPIAEEPVAEEPVAEE